jgi:hypothetical protein
MRFLPHLLIAVLPATLSLTYGALAMTQPPSPLRVTCTALPADLPLPDGICDAFVSALAEMGLQAVHAPPGQTADAVLVVLDVTSSKLVARIDQGARPGVKRAIARKDAPLGTAAFKMFFKGLIAATPGLTDPAK